ncbi:MAG: VCBS repeat-containing protein [Planctomycetota bacterium]|nr:VCBS repeat-containing protein [Planctomycetota bacterium]MDG1986016.1 VCBS repeat-containing protein [Planctomycetota bacterium]
MSLLATLMGAAASAVAGGGDASFIDASVRVEGTVLDWRFVDVERDGQVELALSLRTPTGSRELQLFRCSAQAIEPEPYRKIPVLKDIVSWTFADVRPALEGCELVLLTRQGAWSFDPRRTSYKGNIERLAEVKLMFDFPTTAQLPYWDYVVQSGERQPDHLLLPRRDGFEVIAPAGDQADEKALPYRSIADFPAQRSTAATDPEDGGQRADKARARNKEREVRFEVTVGDRFQPFLGEGVGNALVDDTTSLQAPAIVDLNGDGREDLLLVGEDELRVHLSGPGGIPARPTRVEAIPEYLRSGSRSAALRLVDVDGDERLDLVGLWRAESGELENGQWRIYVMRSTPNALLPDKPSQVLRFEGAELRATVADVDGDGRPDLALRRFEMPSMIETVTGLEFKYSYLLYLGTKRGLFDRRPALKSERTFDENSIREIIANRDLSMDCSGDGVADLVEVDLKGRLGVRRLRKTSSLFGGDSWQIDEGYWKQYSARGSVQSLSVMDLNGDGIGDIVSAADSVLTVYLSQKR